MRVLCVCCVCVCSKGEGKTSRFDFLSREGKVLSGRHGNGRAFQCTDIVDAGEKRLGQSCGLEKVLVV